MSEVRPQSSNVKSQTSFPTTPEASAPPHSQPDPKGKSQDNAAEAAAKESVPLKPKDDDLLRVADRFMENLQTHRGRSARSSNAEAAEAPLPLLPREPPWNKTQSYRTQPVDPSAPSLHIGNLRVDIITSRMLLRSGRFDHRLPNSSSVTAQVLREADQPFASASGYASFEILCRSSISRLQRKP